MKIKKFNILPATLLLAISTFFSVLLGMARDHLLAKAFGATAGTGIYDLDVYYAAFRIPDLIYNLLILGVVSAAFIPIFTQYKKDSDSQSAWQFASSMMHLIFLVILVLSGLIYLLAPYLVHIVAAGFSEEQIQLTIKLMRIMLISPIIFSITSVLVSIQDSFKTFFFRALGPLFYNLGIIIGIIYFGAQFGVVGVTWGVIIGAAIQLIVQLPALRLVKYKHFWILGHNRQDVRKALKLIIPRILGLSLTQLTLVVNTLIASFLMTGSITIFYLANNFQGLPLGMIGIAFAITSFATLSELASEPTTKPFAKEISNVMGKILFLIIPATIGMFLLRGNIVELVLMYGKFTPSDTLITSQVLGCLLISLFAQSLIPLLARGFYAFHNTKIPLITGFIGAIVSIGGSLILTLVWHLGIIGIAIAFSCGNIINFALLYILMCKKVQANLIHWYNFFKISLISLIMGIAVFTAKILIPYHGNTVTRIGFLLFYTSIGLIVYFGLAVVMRIEEIKTKHNS